ncbi:MAG: hypothetical protein B2I17_04870 [Thermoplasmatales archaeon B_DKE]|nr:MAG: hypothetical protein B2I17_04870 [Thermoplasmatales archaeon B_DKE]
MILSFIGKGGVGKTSIAAAAALELSKTWRTAVVSTDFMPSLRHVISSKDNLDMVELSEREVGRKWIEKYGEDVYSVLSEFINTDRSILQHISSAPGVAEEFMISNLVDMADSGKYDFIVWDTAASSATMHLLNLEMDFYSHLGRDIQFYLKVKEKFGTNNAIRILNQWRELANHVWKRLQEAHFFLVTTDDELSLLQASEIEKDFSAMRLNIDFRICNRFKELSYTREKCRITIPEISGKSREIVEAIHDITGKYFLAYIGKLPRNHDAPARF